MNIAIFPGISFAKSFLWFFLYTYVLDRSLLSSLNVEVWKSSLTIYPSWVDHSPHSSTATTLSPPDAVATEMLLNPTLAHAWLWPEPRLPLHSEGRCKSFVVWPSSSLQSHLYPLSSPLTLQPTGLLVLPKHSSHDPSSRQMLMLFPLSVIPFPTRPPAHSLTSFRAFLTCYSSWPIDLH